MRRYEILPMNTVDFSATGTKAIMQNIAFILNTMKMTCPLDRSFGWEPDIDSPLDVSRALNESRIVEAISEQVRGAEVESVEWVKSDTLDGVISPKVKVLIYEE